MENVSEINLTSEVTRKIVESVNYKLIDSTFYYGMRNELTKQRLEYLRNSVKQIQEPQPYGTYYDDKHFLATLDFFLKSTDETRHRGMFFLRHVLPGLSHPDNLLDVGAGNGLLTRWISHRFKNITIIDTNQEAIKNFSSNKIFFGREKSVNKICSSILDVNLLPDHYDLAVLSHVLYYIEQANWLKTVMRVYQAVKKGGLLVIVLNGDEYGKLDLIRHFHGRDIPIDSFAKSCIVTFTNAKIELFKSIETANAKDVLSMLHIAGFFLYDVGATAKKDELIDYVNRYLKEPDGKFKIKFPQKFIVIRKSC